MARGARVEKAEARVDELDKECTDRQLRIYALEAREAEALRDVRQLHDAAVETEGKLEAMQAREAALVAALRVQLGNLGELRREIEIENRPHLLRIIDRWADATDAALAVKEVPR